MEKKIKVEGMMCNHCKASVEKVLNAVPGVSAVEVDLASGIVSLSLEGDVSDEALFAAVERKGFKASSAV